MKKVNEEGVVAGDHGENALDIASGNSSGNIVDGGPETNKKKTKLTRKKKKKILEKYR